MPWDAQTPQLELCLVDHTRSKHAHTFQPIPMGELSFGGNNLFHAVPRVWWRCLHISRKNVRKLGVMISPTNIIAKDQVR